jgi:hypothetical protein
VHICRAVRAPRKRIRVQLAKQRSDCGLRCRLRVEVDFAVSTWVLRRSQEMPTEGVYALLKSGTTGVA